MPIQYTGSSASSVNSTDDYQIWSVQSGAVLSGAVYGFFSDGYLNVRLIVDGAITNTSTPFAVYAGTSDGFNLTVNAGGSLKAQNAFYIESIGASVTNHGFIKATTGTNQLVGDDSFLFNTGKIVGNTHGFYGRGNNSIFMNEGEITATSGTGIGAFFSDTAGGGYLFENSGTVTGAVGVALHGSGASYVYNSGVITGTTIGIRGSESYQHITNSGVINGNVNLDTGNDRYIGEGSGKVVGFINGEGGDDFLKGAGQNDKVTGGAGDDIVIGKAGNDRLWGGADNDRLFGGAGKDKVNGDLGDDYLSGGSKDDTVSGGAGDDTVRGGGGNDKIWGGDDADFVYGGAGKDTINGGGGDDNLFAEGGNDELLGGTGADVFHFKGNAIGFNRIKDYEDGVDKIDLTTYNITQQIKFVNRAVKFDDGNAIIDMGYLGGSGKIVIEGAAGDIDTSDFIF